MVIFKPWLSSESISPIPCHLQVLGPSEINELFMQAIFDEPMTTLVQHTNNGNG